MRRALGLLLATLLLTACSGPGAPSAGTGDADRLSSGSVDVDTPALRDLKARAGVEPCRATGSAPAADGLPEITLPCLGGGRPVDLSRLRGPLVVNLFAQWCGPCRTELPYYQRLHRVGRGTVGVVGVDYLDTRPDEALRLVRRTGVTYPLLADPGGRLRTDLRVRGLPGIVFVAADGSVSAVQYRSFSSYVELATAVQDQLGVTLPA